MYLMNNFCKTNKDWRNNQGRYIYKNGEINDKFKLPINIEHKRVLIISKKIENIVNTEIEQIEHNFPYKSENNIIYEWI